MAKGVPADFFVDAELFRHRLDMVTHYRAQPNRLLAPLRTGTISVGRPQVIGGLLVRKSTSSHLRPANSPRRSPAGMSRNTIAFSRTPRDARRSCISSTSRISGARSRFPETRTPEPL